MLGGCGVGLYVVFSCFSNDVKLGDMYFQMDVCFVLIKIHVENKKKRLKRRMRADGQR